MSLGFDNLIYCLDAAPSLFGFLDMSIAPPLLFYAYIPILILSLIAGLYIGHSATSSRAKIFRALTTAFSVWIFLILLQWTAVHANIVHFAWQMLALAEVSIFAFGYLLAWIFYHKKKPSTKLAMLPGIALILVAAVTPTILNIHHFDLVNCEGTVGALWWVVYAFEVTILISILWRFIIKDFLVRKSIAGSNAMTVGIFIFLAIFSASNIIGEITQDYVINFVGPLGMFIFLGLVMYSIIKFDTFKNVKLIGSQALVFGLWILLFSLLFLNNLQLIHIVGGVTLLLSIVFGILLIRSVKKEIAQKQSFEKLTSDLVVANKKLRHLDKLKTEFLSLASHQLRSPLTAIKGYSSLLLEGSYGKLVPDQIDPISRVYISSEHLIEIVNDLLDVSKIEQGGMKYEFRTISMLSLCKSVVEEMRLVANRSGLNLEIKADASHHYAVKGDSLKLRQVLINLIDNAIKYTDTGKIVVTLDSHGADRVRIRVSDTGRGITKEALERLFGKFVRGSASKSNTRGSGLGLYLSLHIIKAHAGKLWADSLGVNKGSTFTIQLPAWKIEKLDLSKEVTSNQLVAKAKKEYKKT